MRLMWKIILPLIVLGLGAALFAFFLLTKRETVRKPIIITPATVTVILANPQTRRVDISTQGLVQARATSALGAEVGGRVLWVRPDLATGVLVNAGDELLRIDDTDYLAAAAEAEAQLALRRKELAEEQSEASRAAREWSAIGTGEPSDLVLRKPQLLAVRARITAAEATLVKAKHDIARTVVRAPYKARIDRKAIDLGSRVSPGSELLSLQAADSYEVVMSVTLDQLRYLSLPLRGEVLAQGPSVTFSAKMSDETVTWPGRVIRTEAGLNPQTRMLSVIARIEQPDDGSVHALMTGLFVRAHITGIDVDHAIKLPLDVLQADDAVYIFLATDGENGVVQSRKTTVIERDDTHVLLRGDVQQGDLVISGRVPGIRDGMNVKRETTKPSERPAGSTP
jgi:RND family efflux transporter MFP subunit